MYNSFIKTSKNVRTFQSALFLFLVLLLTHCSRQQQQPQESILALVGDRVITVGEFIRRAEYTIRPPYCKQNSELEKKIILNSIIAEKLFAFEAGENNPLIRNKAFQAYIQGRKEQVMRQYLYDDLVKDKNKPGESELNQRYQVAGREYRLAFFTMNQIMAQEILKMKKESSNTDVFDQGYRQTGALGLPPERTVAWKSKEHPAIHLALFAQPFEKGEMLGPIKVDSDEYLMLKILSWTDHPAIDEPSVKQRYQEVQNELEQEKGQTIWDQYIMDIMKNKKLDFQQETFEKMASIMKPIYLNEGNPNQTLTNGSGVDVRISSATIDSMMHEIRTEDLPNRPFFKFDNQTWTVADFLKLYASHPLVFRKKRTKENEFPEQFKLAVADLLRDHIVNQKAYQQGIDKAPLVVEQTNMWRDAILASFYQFSYLRSLGVEQELKANYLQTIEQYLNAHVDRLFQKYSDQIQINIQAFEKIKLTRIDLIALNENVPYQEIVPSFPIITTKMNLNYGKKLE